MTEKRIKEIAKIFLPPGTRRFEFAKNWAIRLGALNPPPPDPRYAEWVEQTEPFLWSKLTKLDHNPLVSVVVPVFNTPVRYLMPMIYSVVNQNYPNWELVLINASTDKKIHHLTRDCAQIDRRIKVIDTENKGIAVNTNIGLSHCTGDYIGLLDHDDTLAPRALYEVVLLLQTPGQTPQIIYSDEDKITEDGEYRFDAFFKPDWSPQIMRSVNYINHFTVIEKALLDEVGGYRVGFEGAQDYDLFLRLIDKGARVAHVPMMLYHWRAAHSSTARNFSTKKDILKAGSRALNEHLKRNGQKGKARVLADLPGFYSITYEPKENTKVAALLLPGRNAEKYANLAAHILKGLKKTTVPTELFLSPTVQVPSSPSRKIEINILESKTRQTFIKEALTKSNADVLVIISSAVVPKTFGWLREIAGILTQNQKLGVIAPVLLEPGSEGIRDVGFVSAKRTITALFQNIPLKAFTNFGNAIWARNVDYLSGRVLAVRRDVFEQYFLGQPFYEGAYQHTSQPYDALKAAGMEIAVFPQIQMEDYGELSPAVYKTRHFNSNFNVRYELCLPKDINLYPPEGK